MAIYFRSAFYISLLVTPLLIHAETKIAGIGVEDSYRLGSDILILNGAGVRSKFFVKVYVGALYLTESSHDPAHIFATAGPKSMQMTMLYKEVEARKIAKGWSGGFQANLPDAEFKQLETRLNTFNSLFPELHKGDIVRMDYLPDKGTQLSVNDKKLGNIEGEDFFSALLKVWIGEHPADKALKAGLLGR